MDLLSAPKAYKTAIWLYCFWYNLS